LLVSLCWKKPKRRESEKRDGVQEKETWFVNGRDQVCSGKSSLGVEGGQGQLRKPH